jgi:hypothetical protein
MESKILKYIGLPLFSLCGLIVSSCQDIDLLPKNDLADTQYWESSSDFEKEANYLYNDLETFGTKDTDSDIGYELNENTTSNGTLIAPNKDDIWDMCVRNLRQCNNIIEKGESFKGDKKIIQRYVAEARFFRAYYFYRLVLRFNDVPLVTKVLTPDSPELYSSRAKQADVEDFILKELTEVAPMLPKQSELSNDEYGRITQGAVLALKSRVALFAGTWAKNWKNRTEYKPLLTQAIDAANAVIASGEYSLYEGSGDESYRKLFIEAGDMSKEGILDNMYYNDIRMHSTGNSVYWGWRGTPTKKLADMYLCKATGLPITDAASGFKGYAKMADEFIGRDPRMAQTFLIPGTPYLSAQMGPLTCDPNFTVRPETRTGYKLYKFMGEDRTLVVNSTYDYHVIRYAEVLLNLAEATYERDGSISDELLNKTINVVRGRKGVEMPALTNAFVKLHGMDMQEEIRRERTIELAFEGFRRDDLRRWKTAETELVKPVLGVKYHGTEYEKVGAINEGNNSGFDKDGFIIVEPAANRKFVTPKNYYYSLPLDELILNPNLAPNNPGW